MKERFINLGHVITSALRRFFHRKRLIRYAVYLGILFILWLCRYPILRGMGNFLIREDQLEQADAIYILGGASNERSAEAVRLYKNGYSKKFICTGEHQSEIFELLDTVLTEAEITGTFLKKSGIPKKNITCLNKGTSTREEAEIIFSHANGNYNKIIILSSKFHLRRVKRVFTQKFEGSEIQLIFRGAPAIDYDENEWWKYEKGLLMVNNEYIKWWYYWWTE
jgi:uncharacterized SAM-binding protein YcdF (DUF218 family)